MAPPEKPSRLGRGLDALLARRETVKPPAEPGPAAEATATTIPPAASTAQNKSDSATPQLRDQRPGTLGRAAEPVSPVGEPTAQKHTPSAPPSATPSASDHAQTGAANLGRTGAADRSTGATSQRSADSTTDDTAGPSTLGDSDRSPHDSRAVGSPSSAANDRSAHLSGAATPLPSSAADEHFTNPEPETTTEPGAPAYRLLPIEHIAPNPFQPRKEFHPQDLADLESSLRSQGLLQPITVRPAPNHSGYELIAGERRLRAATRLGWKDIPAIVRNIDDRAMLTLAMVENLQRSDLDPIEEADGYQRLIDDFSATQQEVAEVVGKERSTVANALRLLALPASVKRMLQERKLSVGHARALLPLETERAMADLARDVIAKSMSVRDVEKRVRSTRPTPARSGRKLATTNSTVVSTPAAAAEMRRVEELLRKKMQTTVHVHLTGKERGEVRIAFLSNDDLERVLQLMGINLDS